ncbi:MAG: PAS domain S-box protein [Anaerolineae bacterium]
MTDQALAEAIIESLPGTFYVLDSQFRLVRWNRRLEEISGYATSELAGFHALAMIAEEDRERVGAALGRVLDIGEANVEFNLLTKGGQGIPFYATGRLVRLADETYIVGAGFDISQRTEAETALVESEERFRATFEQAAVGIAHVAPDGRFLRVNQKLCAIVGYTMDELLARTFQDITHPDDLAADLEYVREMLAGELATYSMEKRYFKKNGDIVWVNLTVALVHDSAHQPKYFISVIEDISQRKQAEDALSKSEARYRTVSEMTSDWAFVLRIQDDGSVAVEWVTDAFARITGFSLAEYDRVGGWTALVHQDDRAKAVQALRHVLAGEQTTVDIRLLTHGDEVRWIRFHGRPEWDPQKKRVVGIRGAGQDVTSMKLMEQEMIRAERMAAMGQVAGALAHEVRNPLQAIQANLELLSDFPLEADERDECFRVCKQEVQRLQEITQNVLRLGRLERGAYNPVSMATVCQATLDFLARSIQDAGVQVQLYFPTNLPLVNGSAEQLSQVMLNLVLNSIESMPRGGTLTISAQTEPECVMVAVTNDGPPIPPQNLDRVFEPFFTTKAGGTGLGLFICDTIIRQHGGTLNAANIPDDRGVRFTLAIPVASEASRT